MTLNLTVTSAHRIYQCADFRLSDPATGRSIIVEDRKLLLVNAFEWSATVCYTGVATLPDGKLVGEWLGELSQRISPRDPLDAFLAALLSADTWLEEYPLARRALCFSVGAFDVDQPVFALVSNFADISGRERAGVSGRLMLQRVRPTTPKAYVLPLPRAVTRAERRRLVRLAARGPEPSEMHEALAAVNRRVAAVDPERVSEGCYSTYLTRTGQGGGQRHGAGPGGGLAMVPPALRELVAKQFPQGATLNVIGIGRSAANEKHHHTILADQPNDPNAHNNYGNFLIDEKNDSEGAERHFLKAIALDPHHTHALGNLANLRWRQGRLDEADALYRQALVAKSTDPNVVRNFALFRRVVEDDIESTRTLLDEAIQAHPSNWRLRVVRAENTIRVVPKDALADLAEARISGGDRAVVEPLYAFAMQLAGREIGECVAAYRTAIAVAPENPELRLNLAQLLFIWGETAEANKHLHLAAERGLQPGAELEAVLYRLAHHDVDIGPALRRIGKLCAEGARLDWDVSKTLEVVARSDRRKAAQLEVVVAVMRGEEGLDALDGVREALSEEE